MAASKTSCWTNWDCASRRDGSVCARRDGEARGYCIPTWYGICHAWAPAALLEPEPNCAVDYNGVTFQPMDIKALLSEVYDGANLATVFTGARFYGSDTGSGDDTDEYGRYTDSSRRDLGPGFMHVALANIIGRFNASVVMDVTAGAEVWNQPIYSYKVLTQREMTPGDAANLFFQVSPYPFNNAAQRIMYVETSVSWMVETFEDGGLVRSGHASKYETSKTYKYLLELDNNYNILGGEWLEESQSDHPDFLWFPKARPDLSLVTKVGLSYQNVRMLLDMATKCA
ncbi:Transglutaminase elicitor [Phytophthora infestans]|uniref:Transglutaminase elicitor n=1 Tax=Phytophthora infestans TaxID=4787 RepID=A0A833TAY4_PHYIN|nr:Transglutaminase elicitor [Phytophthora infestans]